MSDQRHLLGMFQSVVLAAAMSAAGAPVSAGPSFSPVGPQRVIVVLVDLGSTLGELCPNPNCPAGIANNVSLYGRPRHTGPEWETLLNQYGRQFWDFASYGQAQVQYTVLLNPERSDGWWSAPHSAQDYWNNGDVFRAMNTHAEVADPAAHAIDVTCSLQPNHPLCTTPTDYPRLLVISNLKSQGGVSDGPFVLPTATFGNLFLTMTLVNESSPDSMALATITHEFGHQLGIPTHYGNCAAYNDVPVPSNYKDPSYPFLPPAPPGFLECTQYWDIMGGHWRWPQPLGYSRWNRGWIASGDTLTYDLFKAAPFSTLTFIRPVELPPANGVPNLIRLSALPLNWPNFGGYFIECRKQLGGEGLYPNSGGIPSEGLLITSVHEWSVGAANVPPVHVVRPNFPAGTINEAALWLPGQTFTDPKIGLFVRLNGFAGDVAEPLCDVEIDYNVAPRTGFILLWQNRVTPGPIQGMGLSGDIGINTPLPPVSSGADNSGRPLGMAPFWPNHLNKLFVRAHTTGTLPVEDVTLRVKTTQPARVTSTCGSTALHGPSTLISLPQVDPGEGTAGHFSFRPRAESLGIQMVAPADPEHDRAASNNVASRFAFLFFREGRPRPQTTHFTLHSAARCTGPTSFSIVTPDVPPGWSVVVSPQVVTLSPREAADIEVAVTPPATATAGAAVEIAVDVRQTEATPAAESGGLSVADTEQRAVVGSMQVLARVVGRDARVELSCPLARSGGLARGGGARDVFGRIVPAVQDATVLLEYTTSHGSSYGGPKAATETRFATTDSNGVFHDRFPTGHSRMWRVQAFWPGDSAHAPAESNRCLTAFAPRK
jgi:hypothetical protein